MGKNLVAGVLEIRADRRIYFIDEVGAWRRVCLWVEGTKICLADTAFKNVYKVEGEMWGIAKLPTSKEEIVNDRKGNH